MLTLLPALLVICRAAGSSGRSGRTYGSAEPHRDRRLGPGRPRHRPPRRALTWVVTRRGAGRRWRSGITQLDANGLTNKESFHGTPDSVVGEEVLAAALPGGRGQPGRRHQPRGPGERGPHRGRRRPTGIDPRPSRQPVVTGRHRRYVQGTLTDPAGQPGRLRHRRPGPRPRARRAGRRRAGRRQHRDQPRRQRAARHDRNLIIPIVLVVVFAHPGAAAAGARRAAAADRHGGAVVRARRWASARCVFKHVFGFAGADTSFPLFVFVFLVALGIDYNIFLMTRVHEEARPARHAAGGADRPAATGGVITSAGLVLAGTFAVLATLPVVAFAEIGFAVALGVLLDTIIVRSVLVTALNLDIGRGSGGRAGCPRTPTWRRPRRWSPCARPGERSWARRRSHRPGAPVGRRRSRRSSGRAMSVALTPDAMCVDPIGICGRSTSMSFGRVTPALTACGRVGDQSPPSAERRVDTAADAVTRSGRPRGG